MPLRDVQRHECKQKVKKKNQKKNKKTSTDTIYGRNRAEAKEKINIPLGIKKIFKEKLW